MSEDDMEGRTFKSETSAGVNSVTSRQTAAVQSLERSMP
jgi:hypothetical protein